MSWIEWLREFAERGSHDKSPPQTRLPRSRSNTYSHEWVKRLEDNGRDIDPADTYVWELGRDNTPAAQNPIPVDKVVPSRRSPPGAGTPGGMPADHKTTDDPWGLKGDQPARRMSKEQGFNPYDTGVFDPSWTGDFDQR
jgi:hypothetical protein